MSTTILNHPEAEALSFDYSFSNIAFSVTVWHEEAELEEETEVTLDEMEEHYDQKGFWITQSTRGIRRWNDRYDAGDASDDDLADYIKSNREEILQALTLIIRNRTATN